MSDLVSAYWTEASASIGVPLEGISFVYATFDFERDRLAREAGEGQLPYRHCTAAEFCKAFVQLARDTFGDDYVAALSSWHLDSSDKLGRAVFALVERNLIGKQEGDLQADFNNQFDFSDGGRAAGDLRPYAYPTNRLSQLVYAYTPRQTYPSPVALALTFVAVWFAAMVVGSMIASHLGYRGIPLAVHMAAFPVAVLAVCWPFLYRFGMRDLLIVMTAFALLFGSLAYLLR